MPTVRNTARSCRRSFPRSLFENHAPDGHVLVTAYVGGARRPDVTDLSETQLAELVCRDLEPILDIRATPRMVCVSIWPDALPQAVAGHARRIAAADTVETTAGPLALAGGWRDGLSVGEVLSRRSAGRRTARDQARVGRLSDISLARPDRVSGRRASGVAAESVCRGVDMHAGRQSISNRPVIRVSTMAIVIGVVILV